MKIFGCLSIALIFFVVNAMAQEDDLKLVITKTFYEAGLYEKIFFEYEGKEGITFLDGYKKGMRGAFIVPDTTLQQRIPNILHLVGTSHGTEKNFMTMTLISHPLGNIYVTSHIMDPAILLWVNFDKIVIRKRNAKLIFYTPVLKKGSR